MTTQIEVTEELFQALLSRYQIGLKTSMRGSDFILQILYYKCHRINPHRCESNIDSPDWIKTKKAAINPINKKGNKCLQHAVTVAVNHEKIGKNPERISKIKTFIDKYNWEGINFLSEEDDLKKKLRKII